MATSMWGLRRCTTTRLDYHYVDHISTLLAMACGHQVLLGNGVRDARAQRPVGTNFAEDRKIAGRCKSDDQLPS
eukprot:2307954-Amphidinium_carterae.1